MIAFASRKNEDKSFDLFVIYEIGDSSQQTLDEAINVRKKEGKAFSEQEIKNLIGTLSENAFLCARNSNEYCDYNPANVFYNEKNGFIVSNMGIVLPKKLEKKYFAPNDKFLTVKFAERNGDLLCRSLLFQIGMIALHMATMEDPNELYNNEMSIKEELLSRRIESLKSKGFSEKLNSILTLLLATKEEKRINIEELIRNEKNRAFIDKETFYGQTKVNENTQYYGFLKKDNNEMKLEGFGEMIISQNQYYRSSFINNSKQGKGVFFDGNQTLFIGEFNNDKEVNGQLITKAQKIAFGQVNQMKIKGSTVWLNLTGSGSNYLVFEGDCNEEGEKKTGTLIYSDGGKFEGEFNNDKREGKGKYSWPLRQNKNKRFEGDWKDDKIDGEGKIFENGIIFEVKYEKGMEMFRNEIGRDNPKPSN